MCTRDTPFTVAIDDNIIMNITPINQTCQSIDLKNDHTFNVYITPSTNIDTQQGLTLDLNSIRFKFGHDRSVFDSPRESNFLLSLREDTLISFTPMIIYNVDSKE